MNDDSRIYVAGHRGLVGAAICRLLAKQGFGNVITRTHSELDLTDQTEVRAFFEAEHPDYVFLAAAKVGGIYANNTYPAEFIRDNLLIQTNVIDAAYQNGVKKLLFLGSSCIYPKFASQPMREDALLTGVLEPTNEPYALAKIAGIKLCESYNRQYGTDFRSVMPTNLYGRNDNFDLKNSHVIPALIRKFHEAKVGEDSAVEVWGTGEVKREFLHVDDMAAASLFVLGLDKTVYQKNTKPTCSHVNVGSGEDITIKELAETIRNVVGYKGDIVFNTKKPDGAPRKLLDVTRLGKLGWVMHVTLQQGLVSTYSWYKNNSSINN